MEAPDLRRAAPRRWNVAVDGICWLPRLIDKTRAALAGTLGGYLYGQSPVDRGLLRALGVRYRDFTAIVRAASDDDAVLAALSARNPDGIGRARAWSATLSRQHRWFMWVLDVDDGYAPGSRFFKPAVNLGTNVFTALAKRIWPVEAMREPGAKQGGL
jgi:hypothetical protein